MLLKQAALFFILSGLFASLIVGYLPPGRYLMFWFFQAFLSSRVLSFLCCIMHFSTS